MNENYQRNYLCALNHFIDYSTGAPTSVVAKEHGIIGITRIMSCMEKLGMDQDKIDLIALPDFTYIRNKLRWNAGFPYGCIVKFGDLPPFIPLDFRPNCCGVALAVMDTFEETPDILHKNTMKLFSPILQLTKATLIVGITLWDYTIVAKIKSITF